MWPEPDNTWHPAPKTNPWIQTPWDHLEDLTEDARPTPHDPMLGDDDDLDDEEDALDDEEDQPDDELDEEENREEDEADDEDDDL